MLKISHLNDYKKYLDGFYQGFRQETIEWTHPFKVLRINLSYYPGKRPALLFTWSIDTCYAVVFLAYL